MARTKSTTSTTPGAMIDRFRYTPGDGHAYVWPGAGDVIHVYRITAGEGDLMVLADTGDRIDASGTRHTATAMSERVDRWRAARQMMAS